MGKRKWAKACKSRSPHFAQRYAPFFPRLKIRCIAFVHRLLQLSYAEVFSRGVENDLTYKKVGGCGVKNGRKAGKILGRWWGNEWVRKRSVVALFSHGFSTAFPHIFPQEKQEALVVILSCASRNDSLRFAVKKNGFVVEKNKAVPKISECWTLTLQCCSS